MHTDLYIGQLINFGPVLMQEADALGAYYGYRLWRLIEVSPVVLGQSVTLRDDEFTSILRIPV